MAVATRKQTRGRKVRENRAAAFARVWIREDVARTSTPIQIDEENGIVHGLKICGLISENGREYLIEALTEAKPIYVGKPCYLNHLEKGKQRNVLDDFGIWSHVEARADGLYGSLKYDKDHSYAPRFLRRCREMPQNIGFSHVAEGKEEVRDGKVVITQIFDVESVDLVAHPATTKGLSEGKTNVPKTTIKALLESIKDLSKPRQAWLTRLLEDDAMSDPISSEIDAPTDNADPMDVAFAGGLHSAVDAYIAGNIDLATFLSQVKDLSKTHDKLTSKDEPAAETESDDPPKDDEEKKKEESTDRARLRRLELKDECRTLCESKDLNFTPTADQLETLMDIADLKRRRALAETYRDANKGKPTQTARSRGTSSFSESRNSAASSDGKSFASLVRE